MSAAPCGFDALSLRLTAAIRQPGKVRGEGIAFELPAEVPAGLEADLAFAFDDDPALGLRLLFEGGSVAVEPGAADPRDTISTSVAAFFDFFENRRSSQALFLERDWRVDGSGGLGRDDAEEIRACVRALEALLPAPYEPPPRTRQRVEANAARHPVADVPRVVGLAPAAFADEFVATGRPVILRGALPGIEWWTFDRLRAAFGGAHTHFSRYPDCSYSTGACLERIESGRADAFKAALPVVSELRRHYTVEAYFPDRAVFEKARSLLVAPADGQMPGSYRATSWHRDWADNLLAQLIGVKRVRLSSPLNAPAFGLTSVPACHYNVALDHSAIDPRQDSAALAGIALLEARLEPGDLLFIPCGWLHTVENLTATAAINCWRVSPPEMLGLKEEPCS
jgi:hypothetical protein